MDWIAAKVIIESGDFILAEELITDIFYNLEIQGVVVEQPDMEPEEGWGEDALPRPEFFSVTGYLPDDQEAENTKKELEKALVRLAEESGITSKVAYATVKNEDWSETWKEFFWPANITPKIVIKPTWREYTPENDEFVIEIDPGMAFGTGTHPTTSMCVQLMEKHMKKQDSFLDVGTGSGILLIAAAHFGSQKMTGIDIDETAVEVARENLDKNSVNKDIYTLKTGHLANDVHDKYDVVTANILAEVIVELLDHLKKVMKENSLFICSGIIDDKKDMVLAKLEKSGFTPIETKTKDSWWAIVAKPS